MIVLDLKLSGIYGFDDFGINFTYPKKLVSSIIGDEHLEGRKRFRYKKISVLMGANATGKTSLGKALIKIFEYINSGNEALLMEMATEARGSFQLDFVNDGFTMHRLSARIDKAEESLSVSYASAEIGELDYYERTVQKLKDRTAEISGKRRALRALVGQVNYRFAYPEISESMQTSKVEGRTLLITMRSILPTLDPTLTDITKLAGAKDTFLIRRRSAEILIQEGKLLNRAVLSSGTAEGIDVAVFLASMMGKDKGFYYCDEHFSYIHSEIEKAVFGLMVERVRSNEQLIFTTHNMDMLDLNLPKHSYIFLKKTDEDGEYKVTAVSASELLKKNTDSVRNAVDNDIFGSMPDLSGLDDLDLGWPDEL